MSAYAPARYISTVRFLLRVLVLDEDEPEWWSKWPIVLSTYLSPRQRALLAHAALETLDAEVVNEVAWDVLSQAGWPLPPLFDLKSEAEFWAALATPAELKVYANVINHHLSPADRKAFICHVAGGSAA